MSQILKKFRLRRAIFTLVFLYKISFRGWNPEKKRLWRAAFSSRLSTLPRTQRANIIVSRQYDVDWDGNTSRISATHWRRRIRSKSVCSTLSYGHRVPPAEIFFHGTLLRFFPVPPHSTQGRNEAISPGITVAGRHDDVGSLRERVRGRPS